MRMRKTPNPALSRQKPFFGSAGMLTPFWRCPDAWLPTAPDTPARLHGVQRGPVTRAPRLLLRDPWPRRTETVPGLRPALAWSASNAVPDLPGRDGSMSFRDGSPHQRETQRPDRLLRARRKREAAVERWPELLPVACPGCGGALGLVDPNHELYCTTCGQWAGENTEVPA